MKGLTPLHTLQVLHALQMWGTMSSAISAEQLRTGLRRIEKDKVRRGEAWLFASDTILHEL